MGAKKLHTSLLVSGYIDRLPHSQVYVLGPQIPLLNNAFVQGLAKQEGINSQDVEEDILTSLFTSVTFIERIRPETYCIAAPVFAPRGQQLVAALAISFNPHLLEKRADWLIAQITRAANYARAELRVAAAHR